MNVLNSAIPVKLDGKLLRSFHFGLGLLFDALLLDVQTLFGGRRCGFCRFATGRRQLRCAVP